MARRGSWGPRAVTGGLLASVLLLSACSGGSGGAGANGNPGSGQGSGDNAALQSLLTGDEGKPPTSSPAPAKGKTVWWISCGQQAKACADYAAAGQAAATALGWNFRLADGNFNIANGYATAMRTAIAARPDAIVEDAFSCKTVRPELETAKQLGIAVIGLMTTDCSDDGSGPSLFTVPMNYSDKYASNKDLWTGWGQHSGEFIAADAGGPAKVIAAFGQGDPQFDMMRDGFKQGLAKCAECSIVEEIPYTLADLAPNGPFITSLRNALIKHPDANYVWVPFDNLAVETGGAKAVAQGGSKAKLVSTTGLGNALDLIRSGQMYAEGTGISYAWPSWGAMDQLNRHFNGQPGAPQGVGFVSINQNTNMPAQPGANYQTAVPFEDLYKKAWGIAT